MSDGINVPLPVSTGFCSRAVVIAVGRELVGPRGALLERFFAIALQHQGRGTPDIDLGYPAVKTAGLRSSNASYTDNCVACEAAC